jgi:hypothetical protein
MSDNKEHLPPGQTGLELDKNLVMYIKKNNDFEPVMTVIKFALKDKIFFRLPRKHLELNIEIGNEYTAQVMDKDYEYVVQGKITDIELEDIPRIEMTVTSIIKYEERRKAKRFFINLPAVITFPKTKTIIYSVIKNISLSGVSAIVGIMLREKPVNESLDIVHISAELKDTSILEFDARLSWSKKHEDFDEYGMEIISVNPHNAHALKRLISSLQNNMHLYVDEELL